MVAEPAKVIRPKDIEIISSITPSGIEVAYQWEPKRLYRLRWAEGAEHMTHEFSEGVAVVGPRPYMGMHDWIEVPSVTQVLDVLDKPGLPWWGMKVGVEGVQQLYDVGLLPGAWWTLPTEQMVQHLTHHKLTVNHVRDTAGSRGQAVHDAFETWAKTLELPDPMIFPEEERGYVVGLNAFLRDTGLVPEAYEVMVGSLEHQYAGRYDLRGYTTEPRAVVFHRTPVKGPQYAELAAGRWLVDLKTSKDVYPSHSLQLEAYEQASIEGGYEPTDARGILNVGADGTYKFVRSVATFEDFKAVRDVYSAFERMKERKR